MNANFITANVNADRGERTVSSPRRVLRFGTIPMTWYDFGCIGMLVTSAIAIAAGMLG